MMFLNKLSQPTSSFKIKLFGSTLDQVETIKYLGVVVDNTLNSVPHIKKVCDKVAKSIGILSKHQQTLKYFCIKA